MFIRLLIWSVTVSSQVSAVWTASAGEANPFLDGGMEALELTETGINQIIAFLFSLTDDRFAEENEKEYMRQKAMAEKERPFRDKDLAFRDKIPFEDRVQGTKGPLK